MYFFPIRPQDCVARRGSNREESPDSGMMNPVGLDLGETYLHIHLGTSSRHLSSLVNDNTLVQFPPQRFPSLRAKASPNVNGSGASYKGSL